MEHGETESVENFSETLDWNGGVGLFLLEVNEIGQTMDDI